jgi:hypothetical protein
MNLERRKMMLRLRFWLVFGFSLPLLVFLALTITDSASARAGGTLEVKLTYTGAGEVDQNHKIWVYLFDNPDIGTGSMPFQVASVSSQEQVLTLSGIIQSPVYLAAIFDSNGYYDGMSPPASGCPVTLYGIETGAAAPINITEDETTKIDVTFDDSIRIP